MNIENIEIKKFNEQGYYIAKKLLKKESIILKSQINNFISILAKSNNVKIKSLNINDKIRESYKRRIPGLDKHLGNKLYDSLNRHLLIREYLSNKKIISKVIKIFGCEKKHLLLDHIQFFLHLKNDKKNLLGWHQDSGYFRNNSTQNSLTVWMPLQDCGPLDGSLWLKPKSHKFGLKNHKKNSLKKSKSQIAKKNGKVYIENLNFMNDFQLNLKAGDVLFSDYNLIHYRSSD